MGWAPDYAGLSDLRPYVGIDNETDTADDAVLALAITASSRAVDRFCGRQFGNTDGTSVTRSYTAYWSRDKCKYVVDIDDLYDDDGLVVESADTAVTDYTLFPLNAEADGKPYTRLIFGSSVSTTDGAITLTTTKFGWPVTPDTITNATLLQANRIVKRRSAPFGIAGSPEMGSEMRLLSRLDPDVELLCQTYMRWWGAR